MERFEESEKRIKALKKEILELKGRISGLKKENFGFQKEIRDRDNIFKNIPGGIVLVFEGKIIEANDSFLELTGHSREEITDMKYEDLIDRSCITDVKNRHKHWNAGKVKRDQYDTGMLTKAGSRFRCSVEAKRIRYRGRVSYLLNLTCLDEREAVREKEHMDVRFETARLMLEGFAAEEEKYGAALSAIARRIKNSDRDIKSGDTLIGLELLAEKASKKAMMLKYIAGDSPEYDGKERFSVNRAIESAVKQVMKHDESPGRLLNINTYFRSSSFIEGNHADFREAVVHILLHIKETLSDSGEIHITTEDNVDFIHIFIQDSSIGADEDIIKDIFYPYFNSGGLGLSFSRAVIEKGHKGAIEAVTGDGDGVVYQIELPISSEKKKIVKIDRSKLKKNRILVIQFEDIARELLTHLLMDRGCRVDTSGGGLEGLAFIKKNNISMVIADTDSIETGMALFLKKCRVLRPDMLIVFIGEPGKNRRLKDKKGPDLFLAKPADISSVVKNVSRLLMTVS